MTLGLFILKNWAKKLDPDSPFFQKRVEECKSPEVLEIVLVEYDFLKDYICLKGLAEEINTAVDVSDTDFEAFIKTGKRLWTASTQ